MMVTVTSARRNTADNAVVPLLRKADRRPDRSMPFFFLSYIVTHARIQ